MFDSKGPFLLEVVISRDADVLPFSVGGHDVSSADGQDAEDGEAAHGGAAMPLENTVKLVDNLLERVNQRELWD